MSQTVKYKNCPGCGVRQTSTLEVCDCGHVFVAAPKPGKRFIDSNKGTLFLSALLAPVLIFAFKFIITFIMRIFGFKTWSNWIHGFVLEEALPFIPGMIACLAIGSILGRGYNVRHYIIYHLSLILFFNVTYFWTNAYSLEYEGLIILIAISINFAIIFNMIKYYSMKIEVQKGGEKKP